MPVVILIEGLIAAGKTTLIYECLIPFFEDKGLRVKLIKEPVDKWVECGILQKFYEDQKRWAYTFQAKAFHDRIKESIITYGDGEDADVYISERSPFSDHIFMNVNKRQGNLTDLEFKIYEEWWQMWYALLPYQADLVIYLQTEPKNCMGRLKSRARDGESGIPIEYQQLLREEHDKVFNKSLVNFGGYTADCLVVDGNTNFKDTAFDREYILLKVWDSLKGTLGPIIEEHEDQHTETEEEHEEHEEEHEEEKKE